MKRCELLIAFFVFVVVLFWVYFCFALLVVVLEIVYEVFVDVVVID